MLSVIVIFFSFKHCLSFPNHKTPYIDINSRERSNVEKYSSLILTSGLGSILPFFGRNPKPSRASSTISMSSNSKTVSKGSTNQVVKIVNDIKHKRLGNNLLLILLLYINVLIKI